MCGVGFWILFRGRGRLGDLGPDLIEQLIPPTPGPDWAKTLDIHMLFLLGGRQRTREEYEDLFQKAGLSMQRQIETAGGISILEATPA